VARKERKTPKSNLRKLAKIYNIKTKNELMLGVKQ
jgi:hypothetical protein